jgi:polyvinyl alcohol dehydrogenase (cytochrome)
MRRRFHALAAGTAAALVALAATACSSSHHGAARAHPTTSTAPVASAPNPPSTTGYAPSATQWTTFANGNARLSVAGPQPSFDPIRVSWRAALDGTSIYAQPLIAEGRVYAATEGDDVYALSASDGRLLWRTNLGAPLRNVADYAGCGDVDPLGITSTPVIDPATRTLYVVAEVSDAGAPPVHHELFGIDAVTGHVTRSLPADPPMPGGESPVTLLQRAALALGDGRVYVGYGGQFGDCGTYHGWVVGVGVRPGTGTTSFNVTPASSGGAVWQSGGGPSIDSAGNVYWVFRNEWGSGVGVMVGTIHH